CLYLLFLIRFFNVLLFLFLVLLDVHSFPTRRSSDLSKELIKSEIEKVPEDRLEDLYCLIKGYSQHRAANGRSLMSKLRDITIDRSEERRVGKECKLWRWSEMI